MKNLLLSLFLLLGFNAIAQYENNHWKPNPYQFANNMTLIGVITFNGEEQRSESLELGAFCGDECRGSVIATYEELFDRYFFFIMIYGEHNNEISFRCYDHRLNLELDLIQDTTINFQANAMIGDVVNPFIVAFQTYQHSITLNILPEIGGIVDGEGVYDKYDTCFLSITPNAGYQFDALVENDDTLTKQNNYSFIVLSDRHLEAHFSEMPIYYTIAAEADPITGGTLIGEGQYLEGEDCTIHITTNPGYVYEGLYENEQLITSDTVYSFVVDADRHFVAKFSVQINYYQISANVSPDNAGTVSGLGVYQEGSVCNLEITANDGYCFVAIKENDVVISEEITYSFVVDADHHFMVEFSKLEYYYDISADIYPDNAGTVAGTGTYQEGATCTLEFTANEGYYFVSLKEDDVLVSEEISYSFVVDADHHFVAEFDLQEYEVVLSANPEEGGTVSGGGIYNYGTTAYAIAIPNNNYVFLNWKNEDGVVLTTNPQYVFEVTKDINLIASFLFQDAVVENDDVQFTIYPNPASDFVVFEEDSYTNKEVIIYDLTGKIILETDLHPDDNKIDVRDIPNGIYVISVDGTKVKLIINK